MSNGPEGSMWRSGVSSASSRLATLKSFVPSSQRDALRTFFDRRVPSPARSLGEPSSSHAPEERERKISWREWAGDKLRGRNSVNDAVERVSLFPGWASRRYYDERCVGKEAAEFSIEVYISGFAASYVPPESATRSQRAFMRLAKAYASLPKLPFSGMQTPSNGMMTPQLSNSTEDLLKNVILPPRPTEITEESEIAALERQFKRAEDDIEAGSESSSLWSADSNASRLSASQTNLAQVSYVSAEPQFNVNSTELFQLHENLNTRLQPFWSRSLSNRLVRLSLFTHPPQSNDSFLDQQEDHTVDPKHLPVYVVEVLTDAQGAFGCHLKVPWERICQHAGALHIAFGAIQETNLYICADLLPSTSSSKVMDMQDTMMYVSRLVIPVSLSYAKVRLISDIDDTIKLSNILGGVRSVFRNVFVKRLEELVISGMGEWYTNMWSRGVRFHYVSNSPFELLPVINEFIKISNLPQGSIKLRSYAGRSLFNGLLSSPSARKRDGIIDILNAFNGSQFILIGDSGEQDLELYSQIACERPEQILAIFIRDAGGPSTKPIDDPTGERMKRSIDKLRQNVTGLGEESQKLPSNNTTSLTQMRLQKQRSGTDVALPKNYPYHIRTSPGDHEIFASATTHPIQIAPVNKNRSLSAPAPVVRLPSTFFDSGLTYDLSPPPSRPASPSTDLTNTMLSGGLSKTDISELDPMERRRYELQERVYRARLLVPDHIDLRIFTDPAECIEAEDILNKKLCPNSVDPERY